MKDPVVFVTHEGYGEFTVSVREFGEDDYLFEDTQVAFIYASIYLTEKQAKDLAVRVGEAATKSRNPPLEFTSNF